MINHRTISLFAVLIIFPPLWNRLQKYIRTRQSNSRFITCYHNFCIMSLLSRQQSFSLQVKRICRDSSFVTLMCFSAKLSLPARFFSHWFGFHSRTLNYFCNRLRIAKRYVTWLVSNHVWKSGCMHSNKISCKELHSNIFFNTTRLFSSLFIGNLRYVSAVPEKPLWRRIFLKSGT